MIPRISQLPQISAEYKKFLHALKGKSFSGDIEDRYPARLLCATDNSVYQCLPAAVIFPKNANDIALALTLANNKEFSSISFAPRGGGTGTNGQSLNKGIMIDCSRYMKEYRDFNEEKREVTVQAGVIKDELNEFLKPHGLFFSPELSTSSRATIGGMISNDAAGQGSLKYGRTSSHIKKVTVVLYDGSIATFGPVSGNELQSCLKKNGLEGEIYRKVYALLKGCTKEVKEKFPKLNRFLTGYDLYHAYDESTDTLNLARLICGAEGTLGVIAEAVLDLTPAPTYRGLVIIKYENFDAALRHAPDLVAAGALSVETVDSKVLNLAKKDPVWVSVSEYIKDIPGKEILGVNIVEFSGLDAKEEKEKLTKLYTGVLQKAQNNQGGILGAQVTETKEGIAAVYGMRKKAVGLLGSAAGSAKLVAFTEDTVVPPEHLADYIVEFRALLDSMKVPYGMFGHVDTGLMHVRPGLDLTTDEDRRKLLKISDEVVKLVKKYGGQMWGEHGRGYRSCYGEVFFKELYSKAQEVKAAFDPKNILNPGKICVPYGSKDQLVNIDSPMRGDLDRTIPKLVRDRFEGALNCNGNGQCFSYQKSALMCPSYRYSKDHVKSPKGYSALMREWLRLMTEQNFNPLTEEIEEYTRGISPALWFKRAYNTLFCRNDFNKEYLEHIKTCLACKSCKTQCPAHVNAADLNSRFLSMYYGRYLRPLMDLIVLNAERVLPYAAAVPKITNALIENKLNVFIMKKVFGMVDLPLLSETTLRDACRQNGIPYLSVKNAKLTKPDVVLVADPFTAAYETEGLVSFAKLIRKLGYSVAMLRPYVNGKLMVIRGDRRRFARYAAKQAARMQILQSSGITLVGFDPALTICYRDEYRQILGSFHCDFNVLLPEEWLEIALRNGKVINKLEEFKGRISDLLRTPTYKGEWYLFCHCTENALVPRAVQMWQHILLKFGLTLIPVPVACCGMAGLFGHMVGNQKETYAVYERNWKGEIQKRDFDRCLVTGFSCRSQVWRMEQKHAQHPVYVLERLLNEAKF